MQYKLNHQTILIICSMCVNINACCFFSFNVALRFRLNLYHNKTQTEFAWLLGDNTIDVLHCNILNV